MIIHEVEGLRWYGFDSIPDSEVNYGIFTRLGGESKGIHEALNLGRTCGDNPEIVLRNHQKVYRLLGRSLNSRYNVWQVHGTKIHFAQQPLVPGSIPQAGDAMFTDKPEVTLAMVFADCFPLLFYNPHAKVIGIVHSGWQGTLERIAEVAVKEASQFYKCSPENWQVGIGPGICGNCYEVGPEVRTKFLSKWGGQSDKYFWPQGDRFLLDLPAAIEDTLHQAGVIHIENSRFCTAENLQEWFSYRKEKGATGRFGVVMALRGTKDG
ncbi:MAG TPA: peptidoglycan editing factor PgeF [Anaerolineaceae bacterium]|nr:peptidoglycan editing factor PgeF [Anaerolineaceae bacterium]